MTMKRLLAAVAFAFGTLLLLAPIAAAAPDTPPVNGSAVATPSPSCGTSPVNFALAASIQHNVLTFSDPGGVTSGPILTNGTAHLTGAGQSYNVVSQSANGRMLRTIELHGGCQYNTVITFDSAFPLLAVPLPTAVSTVATDTASAPATGSGTSPVTATTSAAAGGATGGGGLGWLWALLIGLGVIAVGGGVLQIRRGGPGAEGPAVDEDIRKAAADWYGVGSGPTTPDDIAERDWPPLLTREQQIQDQMLADYQQLMSQVAQAVADYNKQFDTYRTTYSRVLSGSTELQGLLQTWAESQDTLEKADMAFAILTLLVSGVSLGIKGVRLIRGIGAGAEVAGQGSKVATAAGGIAETGSGMANANIKVAAALAQEAGMDLTQVIAKHGGSLELAVKDIAEVVFARRGWHYLSDYNSIMSARTVNVSEVVSRLVTNTRTALAAAAKRGRLTSEAYAGAQAGGASGPSLAAIRQDIEILQEIAAKEPKFMGSLPTAVVDLYEPSLQIGKTGAATMTEGMTFELNLARAQGNVARVAELEVMIAKARQAADMQGTVITKLLGAGDYEILTKVMEAGGDITKLQQLLGPAQAITMTEVFGKVGLSVGATTQTTMNLFVNGSTTQIYDIADFAKNFGVIGRLESSSNVATFAAGELWHVVTSPFKTTGELYYTMQAQGAQQAFVDQFGGDLQTMATAMQNGVNAIGHLTRTIHNARLDDPHSRLGGRGARDLRSVIDEMHQALQHGSAGFSAKHQAEYEERKAHVDQKLATIERVLGELTALAARLPQLEQWMHQMQVNPDGSLRPITEGIDPQTLMRMSSAFFYLNGVIGAIATGGKP